METKKTIKKEEKPVKEEAEEVGISESESEETNQPKITIQEYLESLEQRITYLESIMFRNTKR